LFREYRTRLISDVVTGKLDVREAAARLPVEVDEPDADEVDDAFASGNEGDAEPADDTSEEAAAEEP
jgi:type I restriction enzyme S subunit